MFQGKNQKSGSSCPKNPYLTMITNRIYRKLTIVAPELLGYLMNSNLGRGA
jgi:hypothetical protein